MLYPGNGCLYLWNRTCRTQLLGPTALQDQKVKEYHFPCNHQIQVQLFWPNFFMKFIYMYLDCHCSTLHAELHNYTVLLKKGITDKYQWLMQEIWSLWRETSVLLRQLVSSFTIYSIHTVVQFLFLLLVGVSHAKV
jgi:hypothetical protein